VQRVSRGIVWISAPERKRFDRPGTATEFART
jgi:hypothetical protein